MQRYKQYWGLDKRQKWLMVKKNKPVEADKTISPGRHMFILTLVFPKSKDKMILFFSAVS